MTDETNERGFTLSDEDGAKKKVDPSGLPRIDFSTFVLSLATSAFYHLGLTNPEGGAPPEPNLPLARQTIDTLEMLEEKTRGNLEEDEQKLLQSILYELRMNFVRVEPK